MYEEGCIVEEGTNCAQVNMCYEIACTMCEDEQEGGDMRRQGGTQARWVAGRRRGVIKKSYIGNTGRTLHGRALQHMGGLRRGDKGNPLFKHCMEAHTNTERPTFVMRVISKHKTNIHRMITEGVSIERVRKKDPEILLNSKSEWGRTRLIRHSANINIS